MTRIAVLISGSGRTLKNLIDRVEDGSLPVEIVLVVSNKPDVGGLEFAQAAGIPRQVIQKSSFEGTKPFSDAIFAACSEAQTDLVVMGGFLAHILVPADYVGRVMNIHPSLIPAFCGKGFYGGRVHEAAIEAGVEESGCTVHVVDDEYDHGPIVLQRRVPVLEGDTPDLLAQRVFAAECEAYPEAIRMYLDGRFQQES